ncbi:MAG: DNA repair and recombination protein RadA, partial [Thermofilum sp.]|uniref:helix-hairpin-helix domain-containing protein n=1 Tax=Thermofilum sp. TaxID=1961369 RepID=UPI002590C7B7
MPKKEKVKAEEEEKTFEEEIDADKLAEEILEEEPLEQSEEEVPEGEIRLEDLDGVGRITAQKLRAAGFYSVRDLAFASAHELAVVLGSEERAIAIIRAAQKLVNRGEEFITARALFEKRKNLEYISTGVRSLDDLLEGGV